jgi:hypothetical protein
VLSRFLVGTRHDSKTFQTLHFLTYKVRRKKYNEIEKYNQLFDQLWLFLTRVRLGLFERDLAHRYYVSVGTVSYIVITWANYLYILLGGLPVWPSKEKVKQHLPEDIKM